MLFAYRKYRIKRTPVFPGGILYRPEVLVHVIGPAGDVFLRGLVDSDCFEGNTLDSARRGRTGRERHRLNDPILDGHRTETSWEAPPCFSTIGRTCMPLPSRANASKSAGCTVASEAISWEIIETHLACYG
jgi:hypothetical protein